ncbi:MAG: hypothetical protein L6R48_10660 [Planctomycetes bacterium]|nr:hypothetical protein [Planctomycetota bacterium]
MGVRRAAIALSALALAAMAFAAEPASPLPLRPLVVRDGTLLYQDGGQVSLWGVNFQTPLYWEYRYESRPVGIPLDSEALNRLTDANLDHLGLIGVQILRVHLCPGDLADGEGNLRASPFLDALDHLLVRCRERGLYLYLSLINDMHTNRFSDSFMAGRKRSEWLFADDFLAKATRFAAALLDHRNRYDGTRLGDDPALAVIEPINEPSYPGLATLRDTPAFAGGWRQYQDWLSARGREGEPAEAAFAVYRQARVLAAVERYLAAIRSAGAKQPLVWNLNWPGMVGGHEDVFQAVADSSVEAVSFCLYPGQADLPEAYWKHPRDLTAGNYLPYVRRACTGYGELGCLRGQRFAGKAKLVYEFETFFNQSAHLYPAMAAGFRSLGAQIATMWHYRLLPAAQHQGGSHFLSLPCTPAKALGFLVAGRVFASTPRFASLEGIFDAAGGRAGGPGWQAAHAGDQAWWCADGTLVHAGSVGAEAVGGVRAETLRAIAGRGASPVAAWEGSGAYFLHIGADAIDLQILPDVAYERPFWQPVPAGPASAAPMCRLDGGAVHRFALALPGWGPDARVTSLVDGRAPAVDGPGLSFQAAPGRYRLERR